MARGNDDRDETVYYGVDDTNASNDSTDRLTLSGDGPDDKAVRLSEARKKSD
ncbi:hypothetical protein GCM10017602_18190 [Herbiconiux flava]|nr:hypothetical protein GCM10017602_18190 [Herbiconiux flava]